MNDNHNSQLDVFTCEKYFLPQRDVENITKGIINGKRKNISIRNAVVIAI